MRVLVATTNLLICLRVGLDCAFAFAFFPFFFFFFVHMFVSLRLLFMYCSVNSSRKLWLFYFFFQPISAHRALFMDSQISLFSNFFIKNGSHGTIHTFKNYFTTIFFSFQFSAVSKRTLNVTLNKNDFLSFLFLSFLWLCYCIFFFFFL